MIFQAIAVYAAIAFMAGFGLAAAIGYITRREHNIHGSTEGLGRMSLFFCLIYGGGIFVEWHKPIGVWGRLFWPAEFGAWLHTLVLRDGYK